jgi:HK97 family phage portal protein
MGLLASAFAAKSGTIDLIREVLGGRITATGKSVTISNALEVSTVLAVARVIGEGVAQVPLKLMQESGSERNPARSHALYDVLAYRPNAFQTSFQFREMLAMHCVLAGNHFSFVNRRANGQVMELLPFQPYAVTVEQRADWSLKYTVTGKDGSRQEFPAETIWHVRGPSWNGWHGLEPVKLAREAIGLAMATEEAAAKLHRNGVRPSGVYSVDGTLNPQQYQALAEWIDTHAAGAVNTGKPMILDRAAKWIGTQMTGVDAESLATRRFQIEEICRFARVNPIMVGAESKNTTYASAEQMFLAHVVHTLAPWYQRIEQSIDANLLTDAERKAGYYADFVEEGLLRGSLKDTKDYLLGMVNGGLMYPNEARAKLDLNPDSDPESNRLRIPANIVGAVPDATGATP